MPEPAAGDRSVIRAGEPAGNLAGASEWRGAPSGWLADAARGTIRALVRLWLRLYFRLRVHDRPRLEGGCVLVANHASYLDPIVLGAASPRFVEFMMISISYRNPVARWFYRLFGAIPVDPAGGNRAALRQARASLDAGRIVGVFPEGGLSRDGGLLLGSPGAVALVLSKGVSIVPVGLSGVRAALPPGALWPRPRRIDVRFGTPIDAAELMVGADRKQRLAGATDRIMREIARLSGQESREEQVARQQGARQKTAGKNSAR